MQVYRGGSIDHGGETQMILYRWSDSKVHVSGRKVGFRVRLYIKTE